MPELDTGSSKPRKLFFKDIATLAIIDDGIDKYSNLDVTPSARAILDMLLEIRFSLTEANDE
jgi:hypothetical protein